jgi:hypothetical protein
MSSTIISLCSASQADQIHDAKEKIAELEKLLVEANGMLTTKLSLFQSSDFELILLI